MIDIQVIKDLTTDPKLIEFAEFVIAETGDQPFPDYKKMDLMKIPSLVRYVFVIKVEEKEGKRLLFHFSGSGFDELYDKNVTGLYLEDFYTGSNKETVIQINNDTIDKQRPGYFYNRAVFMGGTYQKNRTIRRVSFPCSSNGKDINFVIGIVLFDLVDEGCPDVIKIL